MKTLDLLQDRKEDFEWYPTTLPIMQKIRDDIGNNGGLKILDIGAGDGRVLKYLKNTNTNLKNRLYAIEKSLTHIENYSDILTIGTDFSEVTLIDKPMDIIYCNPPYSTYELWVEKIILEANCKTLYLTIPQRWKNSDIINSALNIRGCKAKVLDSYSFMDAQSSNNERVASLSPVVMREIDLDVKDLKEKMKLKIENLKNFFWKELFDKLETVKEKMTSKSRDALYNKISSINNMDFTLSNIYAVLIMVIKESNSLIEEQLINLYYDLANKDSIRLYKSNKHFINDTWRFNRNKIDDKEVKYILDYRIVLNGWYGLTYDWTDRLKMSEGGIRIINDILTVANNLGFKTLYWADSIDWLPGKSNFFYKKVDYSKKRLKKGDITTIGKIEDVFFIEDGNYYQYKIKGEFYHGNSIRLKSDILLEAKAFKNGNMHLKINKELLAAINIEASRILGWIKKPQDATKEFDVDINIAQKYFNSNSKITKRLLNLLPNQNIEVEQNNSDDEDLNLFDFAS